MTNRRFLEVEELTQRILPSASSHSVLSLTPPQAVHAVHRDYHQHAEQHALAGQGRGTYVANSLMVDAGVSYRLRGTTDLGRLGHVTVQGFIYGLGDIASGRASGTLTFSNDDGSITLKLTGPRQRSFAPLPTAWHYQVLTASGAYKGLKDQGWLQLSFKEDPPGPLVPGHFPPQGHGTFTLTIPGKHIKPPQAASGVDGMALVGPIMPVDRPGVPNTRPLPGAMISVQTANGGPELARVVADKDGHFHIDLAPGRYRLIPLAPHSGHGWPRGTALTVVVRAGDDTDVTITYDSGIR